MSYLNPALLQAEEVEHIEFVKVRTVFLLLLWEKKPDTQ